MERLAKPAAPPKKYSLYPSTLNKRSPSFAIASSDRGVINRCDSFFSFFPFSIWKELQDVRILELRKMLHY